MRRFVVLLLPALLFLLFPYPISAQRFTADGPRSTPQADSDASADPRITTNVIGYDFYRSTNNAYCISSPACSAHLPETYDPGWTVPPYSDPKPAAPARVSPAALSPTVSGPATGHVVGQETHAVHGDASFGPSTYMDYGQALALGQKILDQQAHPLPQPSLAEIARALRPASGPQTTGPLAAIQGANGQLVICRSGDSRCN